VIKGGNTNTLLIIILEAKGDLDIHVRKDDSQDNDMMESCFEILKCEMFYGNKTTFSTIVELKKAIVKYIAYYNNKQIKLNLKRRSPVQYRTKFFA